MYISPYDASWQSSFEVESQKLRQCSAIEIELIHIGSTSVPNLSAKNCIDILGVIDSFESGFDLVKPLRSLGYNYKGEYGINGRHYFSKTGSPKVHLHICPKGHEQIGLHLHFKEVMSQRPDLVAELNELKKSLADKFPKERYQLEKQPFYEKIGRINC